MTLVDDLRAIDLPMGSRYAPYTFTDPETEEEVTTQRYRSWTTDEDKALKAEALGATIIRYESFHEPAYSGWEVNANVVIS